MVVQDTIRLSVIIPMYQASQHIRKCLNSVLQQRMKALEIICIDDGSTDDTVAIVTDMMHIDSRIRLFQMMHCGVSDARNIGIDQARGRYLLFLDSDDMLFSRKLSRILTKAEKKRADIMVFSGTTSLPYSTPLWIRDAFSASNRYYRAFFPELLIRERSCRPSACNKLYRREYIQSHQYYFPSGLSIAEDHVFQFLVFPEAKNITFSRVRLYYYRINQPESTMTYYNLETQERLENHQKAMRIVAKNWTTAGYLKESTYQKVYITAYLDLLFGDLYQCSSRQRIKLAKKIYRNLQKAVIHTPGASLADKKRIEILKLYNENRIQEGEQMLWALCTRNTVQKAADRLLGPIRYIRRVGLHSAIEHYIGRILRTEP